MKFLSWMQNKFNGGQGNKKSNVSTSTYQAKQEAQKDEFGDWPHGLLTIGTFGKNDLINNQECQNAEEDDPSFSDDLADFTAEEVGKLQKELTNLLSRKPATNKTTQEEDAADLPLDRFLNCPSSLEVDRRISNTLSCDLADDKDEDIERTIRIILGRCKDVCIEKNKKKAIGKKSISFLLKKIFVCRSGFAPAPSLRDTLPESRMEKLLRTMLSNKMRPQRSSAASSSRKYLEDRHMAKKEKEDEIQKKTNEGCKWVKTDSEYIVLEI